MHLLCSAIFCFVLHGVITAITPPSITAPTSYSGSISGSFINCTGQEACYEHLIQCNNSTSCDIICDGLHSCKYSHIICPRNSSVDCKILCTGGDDPCQQSQIDASQSKSLHLIGRGEAISSFASDSALENAVIVCPQTSNKSIHSLCNIIAIGDRALYNAKINAIYTATLSISGFNGSRVLRGMSVFCPLISSSNTPTSTNCSITFTDAKPGRSEDDIVRLKIYQPNGLNGVYLSCHADQQTDCFDSWHDIVGDQPQIFCGDDYSSNCYLLVAQNDPSLYPDTMLCNPYLGDGVHSVCNADLSNATDESVSIGSSNYFDCSAYECFQQTMTCNADQDCNIFCTDDFSCSYATILCPVGNYQCNVLCRATDEGQSCNYLTILASESTGILNVTSIGSDRTFSLSKIHCPNYGRCLIRFGDKEYTEFGRDNTARYTDIWSGVHGELDLQCWGLMTCWYVDVYVQPEASVFIDCFGKQACNWIDVAYSDDNIEYSGDVTIIGSGNYVLQRANIHCPKNSDSDSDFVSKCDILVHGNSKYMMEGMNIFAFDSFNDVNLTCNYSDSYDSNCAIRSGDDRSPLMQCMNQTFSDRASCRFQLISGTDHWQCDDAESQCAVIKSTAYEVDITLSISYETTTENISKSALETLMDNAATNVFLNYTTQKDLDVSQVDVDANVDKVVGIALVHLVVGTNDESTVSDIKLYATTDDSGLESDFIRTLQNTANGTVTDITIEDVQVTVKSNETSNDETNIDALQWWWLILAGLAVICIGMMCIYCIAKQYNMRRVWQNAEEAMHENDGEVVEVPEVEWKAVEPGSVSPAWLHSSRAADDEEEKKNDHALDEVSYDRKRGKRHSDSEVLFQPKKKERFEETPKTPETPPTGITVEGDAEDQLEDIETADVTMEGATEC